VIVVGAAGRMGTLICPWLEGSAEFELVSRIERDEDLGAALRPHSGALAIDVTAAGLGFQHGLAILAAGLRPVIGTSGVTPEEVAELDACARETKLGGIVVPNFSLGMCALQLAAELIATAPFESARIVETHSPEKLDSPSGTALDTSRRIGAVRESLEVAIESRRIPDANALQQVLFESEHERLNLTHEALSREAYLPGIRAALLYASKAEGIAHGLHVALRDGALNSRPAAARPGQ